MRRRAPHPRAPRWRAAALAALLALGACKLEKTTPDSRPVTPTLALATDAPARWRSIAGRRIFFGHQSVGANILEGVRELERDHPELRLTITRAADPTTVEGPAIVESYLGTNGDPQSKADAFARAIAHGVGPGGGMALYKHCFLDMQPGADPERIFAAYRANADSLQRDHADLLLAHVTMPLTTLEPAPKRLVKRLLGRATTVDLNAARGRYNALLLRAYAARAPVFDLARLESTRPDGSRAFVMRGADTVYVLADEWTDDGGHLNAAGRRHVATAFLDFLAAH